MARALPAEVLTPVVLCLLAAAGSSPGRTEAAPSSADFGSRVAPVLVKNCLVCHNPTEARGGLDLTSREGLLKGGKGGPVVAAGNPEDSLLIERIAEGSMPPKKAGKPLPPEEVATLRAWVQAGATWPAGRVLSPFELTTDRRAGYDWWSLQPLARPAPPPLSPGDAAQNPIDAFVLAQLRRHGLAPAPAADRVTYLRRVKYDLLGLPPTPEEVDAFVADPAPDAYERLVDRLLASPHYGERWGRHWLDVARFGESDGFENDKLRDHAWRFRDYVIRSFNEDRPYAQFVMEQLAGDVLEPLTEDGIVATGFLVAGPWDEIQNVGKSKLERMRTHEEQMEELIGAVSQTFLGLTANCARCHDHKFDPIPQRDYYRLEAVFDGVDHGNRPILTPGEQRDHDALTAPVAARIRELKASLDGLREGLLTDAALEVQQRREALLEELKRQEAELAMHPVPLAYSGVRRQPEPTFVLLRGDIRKPGPHVTAGGLSSVRTLSPELGLDADAPEGLRRLKFAEWASDPSNPLPARVLVNRLWQYHFGRGLVETPSDFGFNGGRPSHPELLDWLASELRAAGGSLKRLHRLIVLSATYRQSGRFDPRAAALDSDDRRLWRFPPRRLEAEAARDAMLAVSGELNPQVGGPSFRPFTVTALLTNFYHPLDDGRPDFNRRTVYRMSVNTGRSPLLAALDCPAPSVTMPRRQPTTTPLQALALMNDSFVQRQARCFAERVKKSAGRDADAQVTLAYRVAFARPPTDEERSATAALVREHGLECACWVLLNASEFLYVR